MMQVKPNRELLLCVIHHHASCLGNVILLAVQHLFLAQESEMPRSCTAVSHSDHVEVLSESPSLPVCLYLVFC